MMEVQHRNKIVDLSVTRYPKSPWTKGFQGKVPGTYLWKIMFMYLYIVDVFTCLRSLGFLVTGCVECHAFYQSWNVLFLVVAGVAARSVATCSQQQQHRRGISPTRIQCCGSGFNRVSGSGSGSRRAKMTHKSKFFFKIMFWSVGWLPLRAEGFFFNLDVLYGGQGIGKL